MDVWLGMLTPRAWLMSGITEENAEVAGIHKDLRVPRELCGKAMRGITAENPEVAETHKDLCVLRGLCGKARQSIRPEE